MEEERARMREHVMKEVDTDRNGAISLQEFLDYTNSMEFTKPTNEYHMIDELIDSGEIYTSEELQTYKIQVRFHLHLRVNYRSSFFIRFDIRLFVFRYLQITICELIFFLIQGSTTWRSFEAEIGGSSSRGR